MRIKPNIQLAAQEIYIKIAKQLTNILHRRATMNE